MQYSLKSTRLQDHILSNKENPKPVAIVLKGKALNDDTKLKCQEKRTEKIIGWTKNNVKYKNYIGYICLGHIQQEFQAVKTD